MLESAAIFAVGVLLGAWLNYRAGRGLSPLPSIQSPKSKPEPSKKLPEVKP